MAIHVNENGTIKEIGTKINGFKIDEVDLLWDNHLIPKKISNSAILNNLNKYRFLIIFCNYSAQARNGTAEGSGFNCYDLDYVRQSGHFDDNNPKLGMIYTDSSVRVGSIKPAKDENGIESFEIMSCNDYNDTLITAIGIACSTTE